MFGVIANPANPLTCGLSTSNINEINTNKLNCGDVRWDPRSQGQPFPIQNNTLDFNTDVVMNTSFSGDFCANGGTDCLSGGPGTQVVAAHAGFDVFNTFIWNGTSLTAATSTSSQDVNQVTAVKGTGIGTFAAPGSGDQVVNIHTDFVATSSNGDNVMPTGTPVNWTQIIQDPDQSGFSSAIFSQNISGTFLLNNTPFPSVQYPNGQSQTTGSIATATLP
jgi:hypothetical protein